MSGIPEFPPVPPKVPPEAAPPFKSPYAKLIATKPSAEQAPHPDPDKPRIHRSQSREQIFARSFPYMQAMGGPNVVAKIISKNV